MWAVLDALQHQHGERATTDGTSRPRAAVCSCRALVSIKEQLTATGRLSVPSTEMVVLTTGSFPATPVEALY